MIDRDHKLPITRQAKLLEISRGTVYYLPQPVGAAEHVFVERLWRSVKYERVYLRAYDSVSAVRADLAGYFAWYNAHRTHSSLERLTPDEWYFGTPPALKLAA